MYAFQLVSADRLQLAISQIQEGRLTSQLYTSVHSCARTRFMLSRHFQRAVISNSFDNRQSSTPNVNEENGEREKANNDVYTSVYAWKRTSEYRSAEKRTSLVVTKPFMLNGYRTQK